MEHSWPRNARWGGVGEGTDAEKDPHHLYPTRAGLNRSLQELPYGEPRPDTPELLIDHATGYLRDGREPTGSFNGPNGDGEKVFSPPRQHRGNAARAIFYIAVRYDKAIPAKMEAVLRRWHEADPVDEQERQRNQVLTQRVHHGNPFIENPELVSAIPDF